MTTLRDDRPDAPKGSQRFEMDDVDQLHVLIVEDSQTDAKLVTSAFERVFEKHVVITHVTNLASAKIELMRRPIDGVILDLSLSDSQGWETVHGIWALGKRIPIVIYTALEQGEAKRLEARALGWPIQFFFKGEGDVLDIPLAMATAVQSSKFRQRELETLLNKMEFVITELGGVREGIKQELSGLLNLLSNVMKTVYGTDKDGNPNGKNGIIHRVEENERFRKTSLKGFWFTLSLATSAFGALIWRVLIGE